MSEKCLVLAELQLHLVNEAELHIPDFESWSWARDVYNNNKDSSWSNIEL